MPQTKKKPTTNNFWKNFQKWMESLQAQGGMTGSDFPAPAPPSVGYPNYGYPGYRSQGGLAWGWNPQPQPTGAPKAAASMPPVAMPPQTGTYGSPYNAASWGAFYNPQTTPSIVNQGLQERGGPVGSQSGQSPAQARDFGWMYNQGMGSQYGLSDLNYERLAATGSPGAYNRYGQPIGTQAPATYFAPRQGGRFYFDARTPEENLWYNRMYGKPGVAVQSLKDKRAKMRGPANEGTIQKSKGGPITSTSGTGWQNALINWRY